jgi:Tfp pilus assembly protein FimT
MGLIATIVMVNWHAILPRAELNSAVRKLASTIQGTRSDAIARNAEFQIEYDFERNAYRVVTPFMPGGGLAPGYEDRLKLPWQYLPENVQVFSIVIDGVDFRENPNDQGVFVRFTPSGASSAHTIVLFQRNYDTYYTIEVLALTGLIHFHDGFFEREVAEEGDFQ